MIGIFFLHFLHTVCVAANICIVVARAWLGSIISPCWGEFGANSSCYVLYHLHMVVMAWLLLLQLQRAHHLVVVTEAITSYPFHSICLEHGSTMAYTFRIVVSKLTCVIMHACTHAGIWCSSVCYSHFSERDSYLPQLFWPKCCGPPPAPFSSRSVWYLALLEWR